MASESPKKSSAEAEARRSGWRTVKAVGPYLWPKGRPGIRARVVFALLALALAKAVTVATPFVYKSAVDKLAMTGAENPFFLFGLGAVSLTVAYGMARLWAPVSNSSETWLLPRLASGRCAIWR